jgi:hypothetical protein
MQAALLPEVAEPPPYSNDYFPCRVNHHHGFYDLPDNLRDGATAEVLREVCDFDLSELQAVQPPRGFSRD